MWVFLVIFEEVLIVDTKYGLHRQERLLQFCDNRLVQSTFRVVWHAVPVSVWCPVSSPAAHDIVPLLSRKGLKIMCFLHFLKQPVD